MGILFINKLKKPCILLLLVILLTTIAYHHGLSGPFVFDDTSHITNNTAIQITDLNPKSLKQAILYNQIDLSKRPIPALSFAINYYLTRSVSNAYWYKLGNLAIHWVNIVLVYFLCLLVIQIYIKNSKRTSQIKPQYIAITAAALWALHPIQLTSVLYVVQRMNSLSALFVLSGLVAFVIGRKRIADSRPWGYLIMNTGILLGAVLGFFSKENALLIIIFALLIELFVFNVSWNIKNIPRKVLGNYLVLIFVPLLAAFVWLLLNTDYITIQYSVRHFSLMERLLTEPRILLMYVWFIVYPNINNFTLFHDYIPVSTNLITPITTLFSLLVITSAMAFSLFCSKEYKLYAFSILWFLAGHSMESTIFALEISHEHRNYLPSMGIFLGISFAIWQIPKRGKLNIAAIFIAAILVVLSLATHMRAGIWSSELGIINHMWKNQPKSARSIYMQAENLLHNHNKPYKAIDLYAAAWHQSGQEIGYLIKFVNLAGSLRASDQSFHNRLQGKFILLDNRKIPYSRLFQHVSKKRNLNNRYTKYVLANELDQFISRRLSSSKMSRFSYATIGTIHKCLNKTTNPCTIILPNAIKWFHILLENKAISINTRVTLGIYLADSYLLNKNYTEAIDTAKEVLEISPDNATAKFIIANAYILNGKLKSARSILSGMKKSGLILSDNDKMTLKTLISILKTKEQKRH